MTNKDMLERYRRVRAQTMALAAPLSDEDCCVQSMTDASPVKWHLAHTTWFFETFVLEQNEPDFRPFHPAFRVLFNSYYNCIGEKHPRPQRGMITRPALQEVLAYRANVDERIGVVLAQRAHDPALIALVELGLQHEQQHQELVITDFKHLLSLNPLRPTYAKEGWRTGSEATAPGWMEFDAGLVHIGHAGDDFAYDNELPRHRQFIEPYALANRLVANGEYLAFVEDGGYAQSAWWLAEAWDWLQAGAIRHPLYWQRDGAAWSEFTLYGMQALDLQRPAAHLSFYEADAYARWAGARLPSEAEWEHAARGCTDLGQHGLHPDAASGSGLTQLFGACWQWTLSSYAPYPGFRVAPGAVGEYNGKFMCNQYVLRGSSCATADAHTRATYRNFFPAYARWQFSGIRLARSC